MSSCLVNVLIASLALCSFVSAVSRPIPLSVCPCGNENCPLATEDDIVLTELSSESCTGDSTGSHTDASKEHNPTEKPTDGSTETNSNGCSDVVEIKVPDLVASPAQTPLPAVPPQGCGSSYGGTEGLGESGGCSGRVGCHFGSGYACSGFGGSDRYSGYGGYLGSSGYGGCGGYGGYGRYNEYGVPGRGSGRYGGLGGGFGRGFGESDIFSGLSGQNWGRKGNCFPTYSTGSSRWPSYGVYGNTWSDCRNTWHTYSGSPFGTNSMFGPPEPCRPEGPADDCFICGATKNMNSLMDRCDPSKTLLRFPYNDHTHVKF
ncbi:hypothetical protein RUM44_006794 [Polyplax serrata]|uniref:Uncharacterized protein n=1 Tax=Polyplax serrata TaxID=468196 RepID=A0ABR1AJ53_POLSC